MKPARLQVKKLHHQDAFVWKRSILYPNYLSKSFKIHFLEDLLKNWQLQILKMHYFCDTSSKVDSSGSQLLLSASSFSGWTKVRVSEVVQLNYTQGFLERFLNILCKKDVFSLITDVFLHPAQVCYLDVHNCNRDLHNQRSRGKPALSTNCDFYISEN